MPDYKVLGTHTRLLASIKLEHMVFPLGPEDSEGGEDDDEIDDNTMVANGESTDLTDKEIIDMLAELGCKVKRIVHGQQARHVYFWSPDNQTRVKATELAYKIKGHDKSLDPKVLVPVQVNINDDRKKYAA